MNMVAIALVGCLAWLNHSWQRHNKEKVMDMSGGGRTKKVIALSALGLLAAGIFIHLSSKGN